MQPVFPSYWKQMFFSWFLVKALGFEYRGRLIELQEEIELHLSYRSPRPPLGSVIFWKYLQNSKKKLYSQLWFIARDKPLGYRIKSAKKKGAYIRAKEKPSTSFQLSPPIGITWTVLIPLQRDVWQHVQSVSNQESSPKPWHRGLLGFSHIGVEHPHCWPYLLKLQSPYTPR